MNKPYFMRTVRHTESPWLQCGGKSGSAPYVPIQLTVSPNPSWKSYHEKDTEVQSELVKVILYDVFELYTQYKLVETSLEFNSSGDIHAHCMVHIPVPYNPHFACIKIGKRIHSICGRKGVPWYVAAFLDSISDEDKWLEYIRKDPVSTYDGKRPKSQASRYSFFEQYIENNGSSVVAKQSRKKT